MSACKYTRKVGDVFEFGHVSIIDQHTKNEKRVHNPMGTRTSFAEALKANQMVLEGKPRLGNLHQPIFWD